jgi:PAS domain S-box-containing protein
VRSLERLESLVRQLAANREALEHIRDFSTAQRDLLAAYRRFAEAYDFLPIPYLLLDSRGVVLRANESAASLFGFRRSALLGRPLLSFFERDSAMAIARTIRAKGGEYGQSRSFEARLQTTARSPRVRLVWRRSDDDDGASEFHVAVIDLTETNELRSQTRRAEEERQRTLESERAAREASQAKDEFLATLSHELRTPLTPILSAVDALKHLPAEPAVRAAVEVIRRNVRAEARLIDDLLDVARITQKKLVLNLLTVDVHEIVADVAEDWRPSLRAAGVELTLQLDATRRFVRGDAARLGQVCRNLLSNAAKFTGPGGTILVSSRDEGDRVWVTVRDTGIGMEPELAMRIFEPFVQLSTEPERRAGLGLGLVICRGILDAHGGSIRATSEGRASGTTVVFELPTVSAVEAEQPAQVSLPPAPLGRPEGRRLLLVEDHGDSAEMLTLLLQSEGYEVTVARSKREGLARVGECDLVISDIGLPDGTGLEFIAEASRQRPVPGIALSGFGGQQDIQRSLQAGFAEHLTKPVDFDRLIAAVRRLT